MNLMDWKGVSRRLKTPEIGGTFLFGGEKQRISIAHAMLKDAPIVIFDAATANVLVEDNGNIVQCGKHEELIVRQGIYSNFVIGRKEASDWKLNVVK